ncbi:MAG TPA: hypothetical protein VFK03_03435 [Candidatus Saccharimonadales bacterium]|nr:hypothetical protein [Candidatus Saccharimonadales bacterium]
MSESESIELKLPRQTLERRFAIDAGKRAYGYFLNHTDPSLNVLTLLSFSVRRYEDRQLINYEVQKRLIDEGFLSCGADNPVKSRLRLPGLVAVSMVVPEVESGKIVGEYLEEPFLDEKILEHWWHELKQPLPKATPTNATRRFGEFIEG